MAPSYATLASSEARAVAKAAETRKRLKYSNLDASHFFVPIAIETLGAVGPDAQSFSQGVGQTYCCLQSGTSGSSVPPAEDFCCHPAGECCCSPRYYRGEL